MEGNLYTLGGVHKSEGIYFSLISELRNPILELKLLAEARGDLQAVTLAKQTLELFDGFLFLNDVTFSGDQLQLVPCNLASETDDILHGLEPLARIYDIGLKRSSTKARVNAALDKQAYAHATHGLVYGAITSLQNKPGSIIQIHTSGGNTPSLRVFSPDLEHAIEPQASGRLKHMPLPQSDGIGSGFTLAKLLFQQLGSKLKYTNNQFGHGVSAGFMPTKQLSLVDII
ncbi:hypothetical protein H6798_02445 [Candidatus Nomurabacteria bacterium]|nr:hypothetical protein [Candidatus Nomurabacteria bacterium]